MALHNTQCPHCFITYVISDEQMRVSEGMVRCGTCRERFQARILGAEEEAPRFDPREAFIEPLTEELEDQKASAEQALSDASPEESSFVELQSESEKIVLLSEATVSESINSELTIDIDENGPVTPVDSRELTAITMLANIRAKHEREAARKREALADSYDDTEEHISEHTEIDPPSARKEELIDEVDSLVDDKLLGTSVGKNNAEENEPKTEYAEAFSLDKKRPVSARTWLYAPLLLIAITILGAVLLYQLWTKQIVLFNGNSLVEQKILQLESPLTKTLAQHDIVLPVRRNLRKLELISARTEAHPTRPSTTLLRVSVINHAEIEQPLPWLEMTLTDADSRLISRRNLSPRDYVYQNRTNDLIGARELKKVTIELLSFPKQATGYEVKILNK